MDKLYRGAGPSEYTSTEIKAFAKKLTNMDEDTFRFAESNRFCLNSRVNSSFMQEYKYNLDNLLVGYKSLAYWKSDGRDNGSIAVSIPSRDRSVEEVTDLLPDIANTFTQDLFSELGIENSLDYTIKSIDLESIPQIDSIDGEIEEFTLDLVCVTVTHNELDATIRWYASSTEDFLNAYGCIYNDSDPTVFQNSSLLSSLLLPKERRLETDLDVELKIIGGLDWSILNQDVIQTFTTPAFNDEFIHFDTVEDTDIDGTVIISETTQFTVPEGMVTITLGQKPHHVVRKPEGEQWIPVEADVPNDWDDQFYYTKTNDVEQLKGRFERSNNVFIHFESTTQMGFVGNDNYYRLVNTLKDVKTKNLPTEEILVNTVIK